MLLGAYRSSIDNHIANATLVYYWSDSILPEALLSRLHSPVALLNLWFDTDLRWTLSKVHLRLQEATGKPSSCGQGREHYDGCADVKP